MNVALSQVATGWAVADVASVAALLLLATIRWWGFFCGAPLPGRDSVPFRTRFALAFLLASLALPVLTSANADNPAVHGVQQLEVALSPIVRRATEASSADGDSLALSLLSLGLLAGSEFVLGLMLAFGMRIVLSGIQLAGGLIDQQAGIALAEMFNPALGERTSPTGGWLVWGGVAVFLAAPLNGDLRIAALMLDLFEALPVAGALDVVSVRDLLVALVQQSLVLSLHLALPLLAVMSLVTLGTAWASRAGRPLMLWSGVLPLRLALSLLLLAVGVAGSADLLLNQFTGWIEGARSFLMG